MLPPGFYCERLDPGWWGEPLNAVSNLGFLLAAGLAWRHLSRRPDAPAGTTLLAVLLALVGLASLSFHVLATRLTLVLDVAFIALFNVAYLWLFLRRVLSWRAPAAWLAVAGFIGIDVLRGALLPPGLLYGSAMYLPPLCVLLLLAWAARRRSGAAAGRMGAAAAVFAVSLSARTLDQPLCAIWPPGLHFVWHLLNALVLLQLITAFVQAAAPGAGTRSSG